MKWHRWKGLKNNRTWTGYYPIMEEDVQALKDVSFYMINIYPKEGLKKIAEAGKIGGEIQEYLNII